MKIYSIINFGVEGLISKIPNGTQVVAVMIFGPIDLEAIAGLNLQQVVMLEKDMMTLNLTLM